MTINEETIDLPHHQSDIQIDKQVVFHKELHHNDNAVVFLVSVVGFKCVMKVVSTKFKNTAKESCLKSANSTMISPDEREVTAYRRLQAGGVGKKKLRTSILQEHRKA